jgi:single-strand DNA-binding protein|tara:strand:+ start:691 stop:1026 length:336 start_codon:yes stop_codon:yes gene_type:complete
MKSLKNKVQLIGNLGKDPEITQLEDGRKLAKFSLATNDSYKNANGEKVEETQWHNVVAWGKTADIIESYTSKGKLIAIEGRLTSRSYEDKEGAKKYVTEVVANEILLLGDK